ncbi:hypothetical protein NK6_7516 [Bradyrhizobium diazoefficiens]|uniref:Uncharacterized protein n=1 Tax=Bradyrhizobium diazoefficiens TaxID=1355477 RepID=A0A0E4BUS2_9BRAD|nr:hypothetical protein NK6_7516 [Bradyrhizobium diazoefficiens]
MLSEKNVVAYNFARARRFFAIRLDEKAVPALP